MGLVPSVNWDTGHKIGNEGTPKTLKGLWSALGRLRVNNADHHLPSTECWRSSCPVRPRGFPIWPAGECCVCWASSYSSSAGSWWHGHLPSVRTLTGSWLSSTWATRLMGCSSACACWIAGTIWWLSVSPAAAYGRCCDESYIHVKSEWTLQWENVGFVSHPMARNQEVIC